MTQLSLPTDARTPTTPDISRRKHKGNPESREAVKRVKKSRAYQDILIHLNVRGWATAKEFAARCGIELNTVSGRFSELKSGELIKPTGERREGAAVLMLTSDGHKALWRVQLGIAEIVHEGNKAVVVPAGAVKGEAKTLG